MYVLELADRLSSRAIPNGVVNSFSTIIIRDMGFSTTKTTQLKSVGDAVQIVALLIGGTIILNVPNCKCRTLLSFTIPLANAYILSSPPHGNRGQHPLHRGRGMHGVPPAVQHMGPAGVVLARQLAVGRLHRLAHHDIVQHGGLHAPLAGQRHGLVSPPLYSTLQEYATKTIG